MFNAKQIKGLDPEYYSTPAEAARDLGTDPDPALDAFFAATGAEIRTSDESQAYDDPAADHIHIPLIAKFHDAAGYYETLAHEACHWTGHSTRLDRFSRFTDRKAYAIQELIAGIGNCMVCSQLGLTPDFAKSGAYLKS
ncbi:zincin-like metallopeptidase domain-containing protein [Paracoccus sp. SM22M-07]|uniref:zincin-like metallopeptidase domain-containing protein n=1 Tax=Paracoccus sp. SM22M-07 TaxID=1520813 RepID=UPI000A71765E|nr:zincin-like metallopeptidase domain-containing protein [Paracoccus sp. SM22M-07]